MSTEFQESKNCFPIRILDPFQYKAFQAVQEGGTHFISGKAFSGKKYLCSAILAEELWKKRKSIVVYKDETLEENLLNFFTQIKLSSFINYMGGAIELDIHDLSKSGKSSTLENGLEEYESQKQKCVLVIQQVYEQYNRKFKAVFDHLELDAIIQKFMQLDSHEGSLLLDASIENAKFNFNVEEYKLLQDIIAKMKDIVLPPLPIRYIFNPIQSAWFANNDQEKNKESFYTIVKTLLKEARLLRKEYLHNIHWYKNLIRDQFDKKLNHWNHRIEALKQQLIFSNEPFKKINQVGQFDKNSTGINLGKFINPKSNKNYFTSTLQAFHDELASDSHFAKWHIHFIQAASKESCLEKLNLFQREIAEYEFQEQYISDQIKRLGTHSIIHDKFIQDNLVQLDGAHKSFIEKLNAQNVFSEKCENLAISIQLQLEFLQSQINNLEALLQSSGFFEQYRKWRSLLDEVPSEAKKILTILYSEKISQPKAILDEWFLKNIIRKAGTGPNQNLGQLQKSLHEELRILKLLKTDLSHKILADHRKHIVKRLSSEQKKRLLSILHASDELKNYQAWNQLGSLWLDLKPVVLVAEQELANFEALADEQFDTLIVAGKSLQENAKVQQLALKSNKQIYFQIQEEEGQHANILQMKHGKHILKRTELHLGNKYEALSEIASFIHQTSHSYSIIQMNALNIISQLDPKMNLMVMEELRQNYDTQIKNSRTSEHQIFEALIDEEIPVAFLSLDQFIQTSKNPVVDWEVYMQTQLKYYGFEIINSWSYDWVKNKSYTAKKVASLIHQNLLLNQENRKVS